MARPLRILVVALLLVTGGVGVAACNGTSAKNSCAVTASGTSGHAAAPGSPTSGAGGSAHGGTGSAASSGGSPAVLGAAVAPRGADIIQTGTIDLRVGVAGRVAPTFAHLRALASEAGGFVADSDLHTGRRPTATATLRVPATASGTVVDQIESLGTVASASFGGSDVTGQVVDLGAEITNLGSEEAAVRRLLDQAVKVADILAIQQQLFSLQGEIQTLVAQRNSLADQVSYAILTVDVAASAPAAAPVRHRAGRSALSRAWSLAGNHTVDALRGVVLVVGWAAPLLALAVLGAGGWLLVRRRRQHPAGGA